MKNLSINEDRLWQSLMEMAQHGATPKGGVCRLTLTEEDRQARDLFVRWCTEAGCTVTVDRMGNIFARRAGRDNNLPPVMTGSHIDSQPTGGKFDGIYGVLAGLEVIRTLNEQHIQTEAPIEAVAWTNEEGSRFAPCMIGSGVFAGLFSLEEGYACKDAAGKTLGEELARIGYAGERKETGFSVGSYFEAHIEQGPILEDEQKTIGVLTGALGQRWFDITLTGRESHAGPTPMHLRKDALLGAARIVTEVNRIGLDHLPNACATVGSMRVYPNSRNVIPGSVYMSVDFRHFEVKKLAEMEQELRRVLEEMQQEGVLEIEITPTAEFPTIYFAQECIDAVRQSAEELGYSHRDIISGAGHDAMYIASMAPTGMIFVPCENGISHNEIENAKPSDLAAGCNVLLKTILKRAGTC
ncbi:Zn-dependent hydrolase [Geopsychrobacter electrodiphilus]|uniref:Zn-dependent hydrolase n=1 Tax=Geopsychrobacter electrodiphilus TaxID=225196 RepID=UPI00037F1645|nr:Zn-dependent hydrolase [Geopsychrobacter electrodiphilus]